MGANFFSEDFVDVELRFTCQGWHIFDKTHAYRISFKSAADECRFPLPGGNR